MWVEKIAKEPATDSVAADYARRSTTVKMPLMTDSISALHAPTLLISMPQVQDPFFHRSVVLLTAHEDDGSLGFVVNRPTDLHLRQILEDMEIPWNGGEDHAAFMGGPVHPQVGTILYAADTPEFGDDALEVGPGLHFTQSLEALRSFAQRPPSKMRLVLGYAGWRPGQLLEEVQRNDWLTAPLQNDLIFATDPDLVWDEAIASVGIDPATLPSWTDGDSGAN